MIKRVLAGAAALVVVLAGCRAQADGDLRELAAQYTRTEGVSSAEFEVERVDSPSVSGWHAIVELDPSASPATLAAASEAFFELAGGVEHPLKQVVFNIGQISVDGGVERPDEPLFTYLTGFADQPVQVTSRSSGEWDVAVTRAVTSNAELLAAVREVGAPTVPDGLALNISVTTGEVGGPYYASVAAPLSDADERVLLAIEQTVGERSSVRILLTASDLHELTIQLSDGSVPSATLTESAQQLAAALASDERTVVIQAGPDASNAPVFANHD